MPKLKESQLEQAINNYAEFVLQDCTTPISEIEWLVERLLDSEHREDIVELLNTFSDE